MTLPKELEKWIEEKANKHCVNFNDFNKDMFIRGAIATAKEILSNPQKYGLIELEKVQGLVRELRETLRHIDQVKPGIKQLVFHPPRIQRNVLSIKQTLSDWEKLKEPSDG